MRVTSAVALAACFTYPVHAALQTDVVNFNLAPLIAEAAASPERFAVDVPHAVTLDSNGEWTADATSATWRYSVRIPTAVSLSFHAARISLPTSATLTVRGGGDTYVYRRADIHGLTFWSRISKGDALDFELTVAAPDRANVALDVGSFQVGFRAPAGWKIQALSGTANANCVQNYACNVTPDNTGPGRASVAVFIRNIGACSGTLLNNAAGDNTPYVLTARHCQNRTPGGGAPDRPEDISVYWNALTPCGQTLNSVFSSGAAVQTGLTTVVEQEDLWLLLLDQAPMVSDAWYAGFDATGASVHGGYTIHHGVSRTKQYVDWFGQAVNSTVLASSLGGRYTSHFWETVNAKGNIGPGASGSALFDVNDRVVGALSLGSSTADESGWDECPAPSPAAPNGRNSVGWFSQLAGAWNSTADPTSNTGATTLKSVLDPNDSGALIVNGAPAEAGVRFAASVHSAQINTLVGLNWDAAGATSCAASGGVSGDGWAGTRPARGYFDVREANEGVVSYLISCAFADGRVAKARVVVTWLLPPPWANLQADRYEAWATRPIPIRWSSTVAPCSLQGGTVALDNLPASGSTTITEPAPTAPTFYTLTCGTGSRVATAALSFTFTPATLALKLNATDRRPNQQILLTWTSGAETCTPTGGAPGDGWTSHAFAPSFAFYAYVATPGTYTYSLDCTSGSLSARGSATVTVRDVPAYATLTASHTKVLVGQPVAVSWKSNVDNCLPFYAKAHNIPLDTGSYSEGSGVATFNAPGPSQIEYSCSGSPMVKATPIAVTVIEQPSVNIYSDANAVAKGKPFKLTWEGASVESCVASGGGADSTAWNGDVGVSGTRTFTASNVGIFTYFIACNSPIAGAKVARSSTVITVNDPQVTQQSSPTSGSAAGGGGGGGGAMSWLSLLGLAMLLLCRLAWRRPGALNRRAA